MQVVRPEPPDGLHSSTVVASCRGCAQSRKLCLLPETVTEIPGLGASSDPPTVFEPWDAAVIGVVTGSLWGKITAHRHPTESQYQVNCRFIFFDVVGKTDYEKKNLGNAARDTEDTVRYPQAPRDTKTLLSLCADGDDGDGETRASSSEAVATLPVYIEQRNAVNGLVTRDS